MEETVATKIRPNGEKDVLEIHWSPFLKWAAGILSVLIVSGVLGTIEMYRSLGELSQSIGAVRDDLQGVKMEIQERVREGQEIHKTFVTRPEFEAHNHAGSASREKP